MDNFTSLFKLDEPIGRLKFFLNSVLILIVMLALSAPFYAILSASNGTKGPVAIILGLVYFYLAFTNVSKRFWDLTGQKMKAIWFTVGYFVTMIIPIVSAVIYIILLFMPGKDLDVAE